MDLDRPYGQSRIAGRWFCALCFGGNQRKTAHLIPMCGVFERSSDFPETTLRSLEEQIMPDDKTKRGAADRARVAKYLQKEF